MQDVIQGQIEEPYSLLIKPNSSYCSKILI